MGAVNPCTIDSESRVATERLGAPRVEAAACPAPALPALVARGRSAPGRL